MTDAPSAVKAKSFLGSKDVPSMDLTAAKRSDASIPAKFSEGRGVDAFSQVQEMKVTETSIMAAFLSIEMVLYGEAFPAACRF